MPDWVGVDARGGGVVAEVDSDFRLDILSLLRSIGARGFAFVGGCGEGE